LLRTVSVVVAAAAAVLFAASPAVGSPVATSMPQYTAYGAVFPDPLAVCQQNCDPKSRGRVNATQFIQWNEFNDALAFMNQQDDWRRYMEVLPLDGAKGGDSGTQAGDAMWPGNNLSKLEWTPKPEYESAGIPTTQGTRQKSDLIVIRVTDENVPDKGKKRYALSLSIHGIERAGAEGGIRAMEELVTAASEGRGDERILPKEVRENAPTWDQVLANTIIYFTFPNPDGWRRGSVTDAEKGPGVFFQRYNGNGIDPNRDWPDVGYTFRPYSGGSEPETRAFQNFYRQVEARGGQFSAGDDLHGQPFADALSYTLLPHGSHSLDKDYRIRQAAQLINRAQYEATKWSPYIMDNDEGPAECTGAGLGTACTSIYAQTWGSVYDTINYTTTGTLGDWFDSHIGLGADGIDNEMSFSHLDRNITFEPHGEQLHVAGNKAIIYSHIADMLRPPGASYSTKGRNAYVANVRVKRGEKANQPAAPPGTSPQDDIQDALPSPDASEPGPPPSSGYGFTVERDADTYSGGMRVDVTASNVQGITSGIATLKVQCKGCDDHPGTRYDDEWITVAEDYNQAIPGYAQAGLTAAVNNPDPRRRDGQPVEWRALVSAPGGVPHFNIDFTQGPATTDANTEGGEAPNLRAYDVANTDFFGTLNGDAQASNDKFAKIDPAKVISGDQSLAGIDTLVLADNPMPGYTGLYKQESRPTGPPTADFTFTPQNATSPGQGPDGCEESAATTNYQPFTIGPNDSNFGANIRVAWRDETTDYDLHVYDDENGNGAVDTGEEEAAPASAGFANNSEEISFPQPPAGKYVIAVVNCSAPPSDPWSGTVDFFGFPPTGASTFTQAQKDTWAAKVKQWVSGGGNLVLTDAALRFLPELTSVPGSAIGPTVVYVGQTAFQICTTINASDPEECDETKETLDDPLAKNVQMQGARFGSENRRQTFEPTPLGYAIQSRSGSDASFSSPYQVEQAKFTAAGGRAVGASVTSDPDAAEANETQTAYGEIPVGSGTVRVLGGVLPQPSDQFDHPLGLEPFAVTYTGYILMCNMIDCTYEKKSRPPLANAPAPPGPVKVGFSAKLKTPLLASKKSKTGKKIKLKVRAKHRKRIKRFVVQYRKTGRGTSRKFKKFKPRLKRRTRRIYFKKGKLGRTYLFRIRAVGKSGVRSDWRYRRLVFPYEDTGKGRHYSAGWTRVKDRRAWRRHYSRSSTPGAKMRFKTGRGGRFYLVGRKSPDGGVAVVRRGAKRKVVSFRSKRVRNRRVVAVFNGSPKKRYRLVVRVRHGVVAVDGIGVRRR